MTARAPWRPPPAAAKEAKGKVTASTVVKGELPFSTRLAAGGFALGFLLRTRHLNERLLLRSSLP